MAEVTITIVITDLKSFQTQARSLSRVPTFSGGSGSGVLGRLADSPVSSKSSSLSLMASAMLLNFRLHPTYTEE